MGLIAVAIFVATATVTQAQNYWNVSTGVWNIGSNWTGGSPGAAPTISNGGTATVDSTVNSTGYSSINFGNAIGNGALNITGGVIGATNVYVSDASPGIGTVPQSGGVEQPYVRDTLDLGYRALARYRCGRFRQLHHDGRFHRRELDRGRAEDARNVHPVQRQRWGFWLKRVIGLPRLRRRCAGAFTGSGTYGLSGNGLIVGGVEGIGFTGAGTFNQTGGTNAIVGGGGRNAYPTSYTSAYGAIVLGAKVSTYYGSGTYNLSAGLITGTDPSGYGVGEECVGCGGTGTFNQTGGTNNPYAVLDVAGSTTSSIGLTSGGYGYYNLDAGLLKMQSAYGNEVIGQSGTGVFTQSGGTNSCFNLSLGNNPVVGTYNLQNGLLQVGNLINGAQLGSLNPAYSKFNFTGGTLQATGAMEFEVPLNGAATIDLNGQHVLIQQLVTTSALTDLNFATPGVDLLTIGLGGEMGVLTVNPNTAISFGTAPTTPGDYDLITAPFSSVISGVTLANFVLPTAPSGLTYSLSNTVHSGYIDLVVAVPEPGTLALLCVGLIGLISVCLRRRRAR